MTQLQNYLADAVGSFVSGGVAWRYLSFAVRDMPPPLPMGKRSYQWLYNFLQDCFSNPDKKVEFKKE